MTTTLRFKRALSIAQSEMPKYLPHKDRTGGAHYGEGVCTRCGKKIKSNPVMLELDQRTDEYHDFGGIPSDKSQGGFDFGADCAAILRERAAKARAQGVQS